MIRSREFLLLIAVVTALGVTLGTSGVSSVSADRSVSVAVTDDEQAFLAFEQRATETANGTTVPEIAVGNQYPAGTTLSTVEITINGTTADLTEAGQLQSGERRTHTFGAVSCDDTISVEATGPSVAVSFERSVSCR